jgi:predicted nucleic acid-binding Zn ribbon protein
MNEDNEILQELREINRNTIIMAIALIAILVVVIVILVQLAIL